MPEKYIVGVDVGTGSARAALITTTGTVLRTHVIDIQTWNPQPDHYEQSSENIWHAVCECVKNATKDYQKDQIVGIGFDATCSLVVVDVNGNPLTVSTTGKNEQNIMLWMDHRATAEADFINGTDHPLLKHFGGKISPETQSPKMLWIKRNIPSTWLKVGKFFDLPDYLTYKCTGSNARSLCSAVAKFSYDAHHSCWSTDYFNQIQLTDLMANNFEIIGGTEILAPGTPIETGLTKRAADELSLLPGTPVGASLVDAYAGGLSLFGCTGEGIETDPKSRMALISGTSTGHMSVFDKPIWASGAWGPFKGVLFPGQYVHAAGQSISGILVDFIVKNHPAYKTLPPEAQSPHTATYLNNLLNIAAAKEGLENLQELTKDVHVYPDYHGNRSPLADPSMRGMISGLSMSNDVENLATLYLAFIQALTYGTRHILDSMKNHGRPPFTCLIICGGLSKNPLFIQTCAEACAMPILLPNESEMNLVGAGILAACAGKVYSTLESASSNMAGKAKVVHPRDGYTEYHNRKYKVFLKMLDDQRGYRSIMSIKH